MFELSGVNYEEVLEQGDSILVRVIASSSYPGFELSGLYCIYFGLLCIFQCIVQCCKRFSKMDFQIRSTSSSACNGEKCSFVIVMTFPVISTYNIDNYQVFYKTLKSSDFILTI